MPFGEKRDIRVTYTSLQAASSIARNKLCERVKCWNHLKAQSACIVILFS